MPAMFNPWMDYRNARLKRTADGKTYGYRITGVQIDADGAPDAYHPHDLNARDRLANAGYPNGGWKSALVVDSNNPVQPYIQTDGRFVGYYLSMTSLRSNGPATDPATYVDASSIPYIVFPGAFGALRGTGVMGDFVAAYDLTTGVNVNGIVADGGPQSDPLGEISVCMAERLSGRPVNAVTGEGAPKNELLFVVFPHSKLDPPWPLSIGTIDAQVAQRIAALGGWPAIVASV